MINEIDIPLNKEEEKFYNENKLIVFSIMEKTIFSAQLLLLKKIKMFINSEKAYNMLKAKIEELLETTKK